MQETRQELKSPGARFPLVKETGRGTETRRDNCSARPVEERRVSSDRRRTRNCLCVLERGATQAREPILVIRAEVQ